MPNAEIKNTCRHLAFPSTARRVRALFSLRWVTVPFTFLLSPFFLAVAPVHFFSLWREPVFSASAVLGDSPFFFF